MSKHMLTRRAVLMVAVIVASMGGMVLPAFGAKAEVAQTGQTTSYADGDDGEIQAGVTPPTPRFMDKHDGTVTDKLTGLIWLKNSVCFGGASWAEALTAVNTLTWTLCPDVRK
jgi:hypothetical protein